MRKLNLIFLVFSCFICLQGFAQTGFSDSFNDGNFTTNPTWVGETSKFQITPASQLQLNDLTNSSPAYLSTVSTAINKASWEFYVEMDFPSSPSIQNYCRIYLVSNQQDLTQSLQGYFVRVGGVSGTADDVSLFRQDGNTEVEIIDGINGTVGGFPIKAKIEVTKDSTGEWELFLDTTATFNNYISQGTANDVTYSNSSYFGVRCHYSSTARSTLFFFDDFTVTGEAFQDTTKPTLDSLIVLGSNAVEVRFSELVDLASATNPSNYLMNNGIGSPTTVSPITGDSSRYQLTFTNAFSSGTNYSLRVSGVQDRNGNQMLIDSLSFFYFVPVAAAYRDVVINEFYPDPSPSLGLPAGEFIELYNASNKVFDLANWTIEDGSSTQSLSSYILQPQAYVILCNSSIAAAYGSRGDVLAVSLPALNNSGDDIILTDNAANVIDQLTYDLSWYQDPNKDDGGYSIEQINPLTACTGPNNFAASNASVGGTPGQQNSIYNIAPDVTPPELVSATIQSPSSVLLTFNEFMDSVSIINGNYSFNTSVSVGQVINIPPSYRQAQLILSSPLDSGIIHTLTVSGVSDCSGNLIGSMNQTDLIIPAKASFRDIVINEVYADFSPSFGLPQAEFVEIYNSSNKIFELQNWRIEDASSGVDLPAQILMPGDYLILCADVNASVYQTFGQTLGLSSLPSLNNSGDAVKLFDANGNLIDQIRYTLDWYRDFIKDDGGYTLEQINPFTLCTGKSNFNASTASQGGTPGQQNSVFDTLPDLVAPIFESAEVLSVDSVLLHFNERLDSASVLSANYSFSTNVSVGTIQNQFPDYDQVLLVLSNSLDSGVINTISITNLRDCNGNLIGSLNQVDIVVPGIPAYRDVVINEFFADPSPQIGLPDAEFIEIYNASNKIFDLNNWSLGDRSTQSTLSSNIFMPGDYLIICNQGSAAAFESFGPTQGQQSFPSLTNAGDEILLRDASGQLIDYISYTNSWYQDDAKKDGGYTLEQINPNLPCNGAYNFRASNASAGGTPGNQNSIFNNTPDLDGPSLIDVLVYSEDSIELVFDEGIDSASIQLNAFSFSSNQSVSAFYLSPLDLTKLSLKLVSVLTEGEVVTLSIQGLSDCSGNSIVGSSFDFALPQSAKRNDIVVNEILFNPRTGGVDFVELYNNSDKIISLQNWFVANWDDDSIANRKLITEEPYLIFPNDYVGLSENNDNILKEYPNAVISRFIQVDDLPSYNDDEGGVYVLNVNQELIDGFQYDEDMHFALLDDLNGVSLERLDANRSSDDRENFHSAAENVGFATPGYENSQQFASSNFGGEVSIDPETFSPDNDGFQDIINFNYNFTAAGYVANVKIYDRGGRIIKTLVSNELLGASGTFSWDGITDDGTKARVGVYILYFESFNPNGDTQVFKETFVLAAFLD